MPFARRYANEYVAPNRKVLIVPGALGSTSIVYWDNKFTWSQKIDLYSDLKTRVQSALQQPGSNRIVAILWHPGESDIQYLHFKATGIDPNTYIPGYTSRIPDIDAYGTILVELIERMRTDFGAAKCTPFLMGEPTSAWMQNDSQAVRLKDQLRAQLLSITEDVECVGFVSSSGLLSNIEQVRVESDVHFSAAALREYGARYFEAFKTMLMESGI